MTIIRTLTEKESKEETKFDIEIEEFYLQFRYNGKIYKITDNNLKEFFSIYLVGIND